MRPSLSDPPAHGRAVVTYAAAVPNAAYDGDEGVPFRWRGLAVFVVAPAFGRPIGTQPACVTPASADN